MFSGIVQAVGRVLEVTDLGGDTLMRFAPGELPLADVAPGDSIAVDGACLTVTRLRAPDWFEADVSAETLRLTTLGERKSADAVNLEKALRVGDPLGGHLVSGHIDGVGEVVATRDEARSVQVRVRAPGELARYLCPKGSICVNGISLTVNRVDGSEFAVNIVPHTAQRTTIGSCAPGMRVNLEIDLIARYLEGLLAARAEGGEPTQHPASPRVAPSQNPNEAPSEKKR